MEMGLTDPAAITKKWATNTSAATESITAGVNAVTVAPGKSAAAQKQKWMNRIMASADKWATNVSSVTLAEWQNAMLKTGINRIATGVQEKQQNMENFLTQFMPYLEAGKSKIQAMPTNSLAESIAKMTAQVQYNAQFKYKK